MPECSGLPIDATPLPEWAKTHLSPAQLRLDRGLLWSLLVYESRALTDSATSVAQRLFVHAIGKDVKQMWPTQQRIAHDVKLSENTVITALDLLVEQGWILKEPKPGDRRRWIYTLAWPVVDRVAAGAPKTDRCGHPTGKGKSCTRPAGWGTAHRGAGQCKLHDPESPQPLRESEDVQEAGSPQPLRSSASGSPQTVEPITSTVEEDSPQPLEQEASTVEDKYVRECVTEFVNGSDQGSLPLVAEVEVPPHPSQKVEGSTTSEQPNRTKPTHSPSGDANRLAADARGRRWLAENFFLDDDQADEVIAIVRGIDPTIRNLARYLETMHREKDGTPKPDLLDIVEAVQTAGQQPPDGLEPEESSPGRGTFERAPICDTHPGAPEDPDPIDGNRCQFCNDNRRRSRSSGPPTDLLAGLRSNVGGTRDRMRQVRPGSKPVIARIAYSPDPALDAHREAVLRSQNHRELPEVDEPLEQEDAASA